MRLSRLVLTDFRNLPRLEVEVGDAPVVALVGANGVGKTSVLEAVSLLGGGRGLLGADPKEQVRMGAEKSGFGVYAEGEGRTFGLGYRAGRREVRVDGAEARAEDLGVRVVALAPELDRVFFDSPGERRVLLDDWAAQDDAGHDAAVERYAHHLKARMKILLAGGAMDWLEAEERQAAEWGVRVLQGRARYLERLAAHAEGVALALAGGALEILEAPDRTMALKGKFERSRDIDARLERTNAGPNTLDVVATLAMDGRPVAARRASSGQHKRVLLRWLAAHVRLLMARGGEAPLVVVDELGAHLDAAGRAEVMDALTALGAQVWVSDVAAPEGARVVGL